MRRSDVVTPETGLRGPSTATRRPTGHCNDCPVSNPSSSDHILPRNLLFNHSDVSLLAVWTSRFGPVRAYNGIKAGLTKHRRFRIESLDISDCKLGVGSINRRPVWSVSPCQWWTGVPSRRDSSVKVMDPDQILMMVYMSLHSGIISHCVCCLSMRSIHLSFDAVDIAVSRDILHKARTTSRDQFTN